MKAWSPHNLAGIDLEGHSWIKKIVIEIVTKTYSSVCCKILIYWDNNMKIYPRQCCLLVADPQITGLDNLIEEALLIVIFGLLPTEWILI